MFIASVGVSPDAFERVDAFVRRVADDFARAFELGFFAPATLTAPVALRPLGPALIAIEIEAAECPPAVLRILWGMCQWGRLREGLPLEWLGVRLNGVEVPLASMVLPPIRLNDHRAFRLARPAFVGFGEQMVVLAEFSRPPEEPHVELLEAGLRTWEAMMFGGFPPDGSLPGESAIGATSGHLIMPATYQWFVEGLAADSDCLDLLVKFFEVQSARLALRAVDIES